MNLMARELTVDEQKNACKLILYKRALRHLPGLGIEDIMEFNPLDDGTILFGVKDSRVTIADVRMPHPTAIKNGLYRDVGADVPIHITVTEHWAWIALRGDGVLINHEACIDGLVRQLILRDLAKWVEKSSGCAGV